MKILKIEIRKMFVILLWLIAIHSISFGIALIILPCNVLEFFGFTITEKFFAIQGGVFHLIISYAYITAALDPEHSRPMIILSIFTKFSATVFLLGFYFFGKPILMVLFSGIIDFLMGLVILLLYQNFLKSQQGVLPSGKSEFSKA